MSGEGGVIKKLLVIALWMVAKKGKNVKWCETLVFNYFFRHLHQ